MQELRKVRLPTFSSTNSKPQEKTVAKSRTEVLERYISSLLFTSEMRQFASRLSQIESTVTFAGVYKKLLDEAKRNAAHFDPSVFASTLPEELKEAFAVLYMESNEPTNDGEADFELALEELKNLQHKEKRQQAARRLGELELKDELSETEQAELYSVRAIMMEK